MASWLAQKTFRLEGTFSPRVLPDSAKKAMLMKHTNLTVADSLQCNGSHTVSYNSLVESL